MNKNLFEIEKSFQPFLKNDDYTFIGPTNQKLLSTFYYFAACFSPSHFFYNSIHNILSNKNLINYILKFFKKNEKRIYVVIKKNDNIVAHIDINEYCKRNKIEFNILN